MKNVFKKVMFMFMVLFAFSSVVSGALSDITNTYYSYDAADTTGTNMEDLSGNGYDGTCTNMASNCNTDIGLLKNSSLFDGTNDYIVNISSPSMTASFTLSSWIYLNEEADANQKFIIESRDSVTTSNANYYLYLPATNDYLSLGYNDGAYVSCVGTTDLVANTWYHVLGRFDTVTNNVTLYIDGSLEQTCTGLTGTPVSTGPQSLYIGSDRGAGSYFDGFIDETAILNESVSNTEISQLYNGGLAYNYYGTTPSIVSNLTSYYDSLTNNISLTTTTNSNYSYSLNGGAELSIKNETNSTSILLTGVVGLNNVTWISTDSNGQANTSETFTIDITNPFLNVTSGTTINSFIINFTTLITYSDTNIDTCIVTINADTTNCNNETYTSTSSGFHNFNVTATDFAGNSNSSLNNNLTINPYHYWYFQNSSGGTITSFTVDGISFTDKANFTTTELGLGNHTFNFSKIGYNDFSYTRNINNSGTWNETINVSDSTLIIRIYDRETGNLLTGLTTLTLLATTGANTTTTTGLANLSNYNFISEDYELLAEHSGYGSESVFFTFSNQENLNIDIYMINTSTVDYGTVKIVLKNSLSQFIEGGICSALEWKPTTSSFVTVAQGSTDVNGEHILNIELNTKWYKFACTKDVFTTTTDSVIVQVDASTLTIILNDVASTPTPLFSNLVTTLTNTTTNATHQLLTYTFADTDGLVTQGCVKVYSVQGNRETYINQSCSSTSSGTILLSVNTNNTNSILVKGVIDNNDVSDYVTNTILFIGTGSIVTQFQTLGLAILIPTMFALLGLGLGFLLKDINFGVIAMSIGVWLGVALTPTVLSAGVATFISILVILMIWGGFKRK